MGDDQHASSAFSLASVSLFSLLLLDDPPLSFPVRLCRFFVSLLHLFSVLTQFPSLVRSFFCRLMHFFPFFSHFLPCFRFLLLSGFSFVCGVIFLRTMLIQSVLVTPQQRYDWPLPLCNSLLILDPLPSSVPACF